MYPFKCLHLYLEPFLPLIWDLYPSTKRVNNSNQSHLEWLRSSTWPNLPASGTELSNWATKTMGYLPYIGDYILPSCRSIYVQKAIFQKKLYEPIQNINGSCHVNAFRINAAQPCRTLVVHTPSCTFLWAPLSLQVSRKHRVSEIRCGPRLSHIFQICWNPPTRNLTSRRMEAVKNPFPMDPRSFLQGLTLRIQSPCQMMIGVYNHLLSKVFRFHYHSQKVIGSLGLESRIGEICASFTSNM